MTASEPQFASAELLTQLNDTLARQKKSYLDEGEVTAEARIDRINRAIDALVRNAERISEAMNADFGCRPRQVNLMTDVSGSIGCLKHSRKHLKRWMRAESRPSMFPLGLLGSRSKIEYQPKGVVGVIAPWNFPLGMVFEPLANILAAGNRAMIKPSEFTPETAAVIKALVSESFDATELAVITGGPEVGQAFSSLPYDHMIFTGATSVAKHIMAAAAKNLVPVTLELGGKSPTVISRSADLEQTMERIMSGKCLNAGQVCIAPDYLMVPEESLDQVVALAQKSVAQMYPTLLANPQFTAVINQRHHDRLSGYLADAEARGAQIIPINPADESFETSQSLKMPPTLVIEPDNDALCMQEEMFGPILPIKTYRNFDDAIDFINSQPRPLAAYYFGTNATEESNFLKRTTSGGACVNDVMFHMLQKDLPFGGVGPSGMGAYHGIEGFKTFSHAKGVYRQTRSFNVSKLGGFLPPYGDASEKAIKAQVKR
ncbi:coniferyl aldehyde dehydrogenase [Paraglaciecola sp.]|nr:coniferyl aldehyde dehydrogenase [Paraglaciecola sp.]MDA9368109.1 coniferyl aldehyde dehydrogenase [Flavobacteriaceae bacterium]MDB4281499.1 coniferyl aldehyde dehydrogenase [Paraglaciecola sp.]